MWWSYFWVCNHKNLIYIVVKHRYGAFTSKNNYCLDRWGLEVQFSINFSSILSLAHRISGWLLVPLNKFSLSLFALWGSCPHSVNWQKDRRREYSLRKQIPADLPAQTPCWISHSRCICGGIAPRLSEVHPKATAVSMLYSMVFCLSLGPNRCCLLCVTSHYLNSAIVRASFKQIIYYN